jgi:hypothetical protein
VGEVGIVAERRVRRFACKPKFPKDVFSTEELAMAVGGCVVAYRPEKGI